MADHFVFPPHPISILWKCSAASLASGLVTYPIRSGAGPGLPPPDLPQVSDTPLWLSIPAVDSIVVERVKYNWEDPLNLESQLTEEEIAIRYGSCRIPNVC